MTDIKKVASFLREKDNFLIVCHQNPDGDTIGSAFALKSILKGMGKRATVVCQDEFPEKYGYMTDVQNDEALSYDSIITVDVADRKLLGKDYEDLKIDLSIDHHISNTGYAEINFLIYAAANTENILSLAEELGAPLDKYTADCIYTGITTDTGCFRYASVTEGTHDAARKAIKAGADHAKINRIMFETKSLARIKAEHLVIKSLETHFADRCALMVLTQEMLTQTGAREDELEGTASLPREIEGVLVGALFREKPDGSFKVSVRTNEPVDASVLCSSFGGGGHKAAAACVFNCSLDEAKQQFLEEVGKIFNGRDLNS